MRHPLEIAVLAALSALAAVPAAAQQPDATALYVKSLAATCATCHGTNGRAVEASAVPGLAGMNAALFQRADEGVQERRARGDGDAPAREGLQRCADRRTRRLLRGATALKGAPMMQRRSFLQGTSALSLLGLSACATPSRAPTTAKVLVIGGGYGGATAAKYVRLLSEQKIDVVLVEPNDAFVSCPLSNLVLGGSRTMADITTPYAVSAGVTA